MARLDLNESTVQRFIERVNNIDSETQRQWGTMGPEKLLRHLSYILAASLGEEKAEKIFLPVPGFLLWVLFFKCFTNWPHNAFSAPESFFPEGEGDLSEARSACVEAIQRFVEQLEAEPTQTGFSPLLGDIPLTKWARVHGVHMDHHLRQYGV